MYQSFQSNHFQTPRYWALSSCLHESAKMVFSSRDINFTCHLPSTIGLVHPLRQSRMHQETPRRKVEVAMKLTRLRLYLVLSILPLALRYPKPWLFYPQTCKMMMLMRTSTICKAEQAYPESASFPSGEMSTLRAHDVWPINEVTVPPGASRTSCKTSLLSSEALIRSWVGIQMPVVL